VRRANIGGGEVYRLSSAQPDPPHGGIGRVVRTTPQTYSRIGAAAVVSFILQKAKIDMLDAGQINGL